MRPYKSGAVPGMSNTTAPWGANGEQVREESEQVRTNEEKPQSSCVWFLMLPKSAVSAHSCSVLGKAQAAPLIHITFSKCSSNWMSRFGGNIFGSQFSHQERSK